jgi:hypothetical protein
VRQETRSNRPRLSWKRGLFLSLVIMITVAFGAEAVSRVLFAPWSIDYGGRDTLTGAWVGSLRARQGAEYGLTVNLQYRGRESGGRRSRGSSSFGSLNIQGHGTLCTPVGQRYEYTTPGHADPDGKVTRLWLEYGDPTLSGLDLRLAGAWQSPILTLVPDANPFRPNGAFEPAHPRGGDDPDDSFTPATLNKDTAEAFEAICQRIRQ